MEKEIPFGAFDSELMHQEIYIPEGFEATIEGNKIILKKKESEDEGIRKELIAFLKENHETGRADETWSLSGIERWLAWLEKQGELKPIINIPSREVILSIWDLGNEWKELTNGSISTEYGTQLDYIQKHWYESEYYLREKQGEQKPADKIEKRFEVGDEIQTDNEAPLTITRIDKNGYWSKDLFICNFDDSAKWELIGKVVNKVEPKFKVGDWVVTDKGDIIQIAAVNFGYYTINNGMDFSMSYIDKYWHLWTIQDANDGDVLATKNTVFIFKHKDKTGLSLCKSYCEVIGNSKLGFGFDFSINSVYPATKEQRKLLFAKIKESGYEWDAEKKELKKVEDEEYNGEDYGIDSLYHAQRILEKNLGKVSGYQTDDGILSHKCAITAVKKLCEQKSTEWGEEDERIYRSIIDDTVQENQLDTKQINWLKTLKQRNTWKPSLAQMNALSIVSKGNAPDDMEAIVSLYNDLKKLTE